MSSVNPTSILLKGGTILQHNNDNTVSAVKADVLIERDIISKIGAKIFTPSSSTNILDCCDKIISPGFIDTHRHLWQTQLKGRHGNQLLMEYMLTGNAMESVFSAEDAKLGELAGALESLDAGTTTVVDHAHISRSPEHVDALLTAIKASGIRAVICPAVVSYVDRWEPKLQYLKNPLADWFMDVWDAAADKASATGEGRMYMGLSFDGWNMKPEKIKELFSHVRGYKFPSHLVTSHLGMQGHPAKQYQAVGILEKDILVAHPNELDHASMELIKKYDIYGSTSPSTELQMNLGRPTALREDLFSHSSLGIDCHTATNASIIEEARLLLQWARATNAAKYIEAGKQWELPGVGFTVEQAFNLATIHGARAARLEKEVGSIAVGKKADLVILDGMSPTMVCGGRHDPLTAVVLHSTPRDIETVIVNGVIRKDKGLLLPVTVDGQQKDWAELAKQLTASYEVIQKKIASLRLGEREGELFQALMAGR